MIYNKTNSEIILNIPHSSINIPNDINFYINQNDLYQEALFMADLYTDELFKNDNLTYIISDISRIVVDIERYDDDSKELMSKVGMGAIYTKTSNGNILKDKSKTLMDTYYYPYHKKLTELSKDKKLLLDCHSFSSEPRKYEPFKEKRNMDICIGFNKNTNKYYIELIKEYFEKKGLTVSFNNPFEGSLVPNSIKENSDFSSIMIEINRKIYMDESSYEKNKNFNYLKKIIQELYLNI